MSKVLIISPHPDDETLGCGGTLLRHKSQGDQLYWCIITEMKTEMGWSDNLVKSRINEINSVKEIYEFIDVFNFGIPPTKVDTVPISDIVEKLSDIYKIIEPEIIYMPFPYDVHTDHQIVSKALKSTYKWFRHPYLRKILMYETLSETEFSFEAKNTFCPNVFINISEFLDLKIDVMKIFKSEMGNSPFPRSEKTIRSLAAVRGSQSGYKAAEAFQLLYERK